MPVTDIGRVPADLRLVLTPQPRGPNGTDGRWWPRTRDLAVELPALVAAVAQEFGAVEQISVDPEAWDRRPATITIGDRVVPLDWFGARERHVIGLLGAHSSYLELLVVPPDTAPIVALACLAMQTRAGAPWLPEREQLSRWENDGGRAAEPPPTSRTPSAATHPTAPAHPDHRVGDRTEQERVARQMARVTDRLCREFTPAGGVAAQALREQVRKAWADFGSPKVITYLPVLVERTVRSRLRPVPRT